MRQIKLTGREASIVRVLGFEESMMGADIQDVTHMDIEDVADTLNSLMSAGFIESVPFYDQVELAQVPVTAFELNPAYAQELRKAIYRR